MGALLFFCAGGFSVSFSPVSALWAALFAVIMLPYYMIGIKVLSLGSLAIYSMFMMLGGMLVPFFYGIIFLEENISIAQIVGTVLLTVFIVLQAIWQKEPDGTMKALSPRQVADLLGHSTSQITELYYVKKDTARLSGITEGFEI